MADGESALQTGVIYCDDNLLRLHDFAAESVDLVYLDPPFFSNRNYEVIWGDEAEVRSFEDRWQGGMRHYIEWMRQRLLQLHRVLKPTGSLYLHCDPNASHYLKVMLDGLFGPENFRNEIVWKRTSAHSGARRFGPVHDVLLFYTRSAEYTWHQSFQPLPQETVDQWYNNVEPETGRRFNRADLTAAGTRSGPSGQPWRGIDPTRKGRHWAIPGFVSEIVAGKDTQEALEALDAAGRLHWPKRSDGMPMLKRYLHESRGVPAQDVVTHISPLNNATAERLGYPTQKPEALLSLLISSSSNEGDVVLDPFCGCGTTLAVAHRLRRAWVGVDISPTAVRIMRRRLNRLGAFDFDIVGLPENEEDLRELKPFEFQNWIIDVLHGVHAPRKVGDMGIDGYSFFERLPIQVKQSDRVGRQVVDGFETAVRREGKHKGWIVAFSFTRGAHEEAARAKVDGLEIGLVRVATLLDNPTDEPLRAGLKALDAELLTLARNAAQRGVIHVPPQRTAEELVASDRAS